MNVAVPVLSAGDIAHLVSMTDAVDAMRRLFRTSIVTLPRSVAAFADGELLVMPASTSSSAGAKLITVVPGNRDRGLPAIQGLYVLFSGIDGRTRALLDGAALTMLRTPAVSAVATVELATPDACTLGVVGAGTQARSHVAAMLVARPTIREVFVANRSAAAAEALCATIAEAHDIVARPAEIGEVAASDIICCCTPAEQSVLPITVAPHAHINAIGSYRANMRELPAALVAACDVFVDDRDAARAEAGDLIQAVGEGAWSWDAVRGDLGDLVCGRAQRGDTGSPTLFKSVGLAIEDLAIAHLAATRAGIEL